MRPRVIAVRVALCVAVVASVATSSAEWSRSANAVLPAGTLTSQVTELHYMIHAELQGGGPLKTTGGVMTVEMSLTSQMPTAADTSFLARLTSLSHPDAPPEERAVHFAMNTGGLYIDMGAWDGCSTGPCTEDFELTIIRPALDLPPIDVAGTAYIDVSGSPAEAPAGTTLSITVTALP